MCAKENAHKCIHMCTCVCVYIGQTVKWALTSGQIPMSSWTYMMTSILPRPRLCPQVLTTTGANYHRCSQIQLHWEMWWVMLRKRWQGNLRPAVTPRENGCVIPARDQDSAAFHGQELSRTCSRTKWYTSGTSIPHQLWEAYQGSQLSFTYIFVFY